MVFVHQPDRRQAGQYGNNSRQADQNSGQGERGIQVQPHSRPGHAQHRIRKPEADKAQIDDEKDFEPRYFFR